MNNCQHKCTTLWRCAAILASLVLTVSTTSCDSFLGSNEVQAVYRYTLRAYYLDGGNRVITMIGYHKPVVETGRRWWSAGSYSLVSYHGYNGRIRECEKAVCRYDLLHVEDVTEDYYNAKIVSSRVTGNGFKVYTITKKGGAL